MEGEAKKKIEQNTSDLCEECEQFRYLRTIVFEPFLAYPQLTEQERQAASLASRGRDYKQIAAALECGTKSVYRYLDAAATKISEQDGKEITKNDLVDHVLRRIREVIT